MRFACAMDTAYVHYNTAYMTRPKIHSICIDITITGDQLSNCLLNLVFGFALFVRSDYRYTKIECNQEKMIAPNIST